MKIYIKHTQTHLISFCQCNLGLGAVGGFASGGELRVLWTVARCLGAGGGGEESGCECPRLNAIGFLSSLGETTPLERLFLGATAGAGGSLIVPSSLTFTYLCLTERTGGVGEVWGDLSP